MAQQIEAHHGPSVFASAIDGVANGAASIAHRQSAPPTDNGNGSTTISQFGLEYTVLRNSNITAIATGTYPGIATLSDCINTCDTIGFCSAVNFDLSLQQCWTFATWTGNVSSSIPEIVSSDDTVAAYASLSQLEALNTTHLLCPHPNLSRQQASNGAEYKTICGSDIPGGDFGPAYVSSEPAYFATSTRMAWHADNYEQCMDMCATSHPLCRAFVFAKSMTWVNCYLKNAMSIMSIPGLGMNNHRMHSGIIFQPEGQKIQSQKCKENKEVLTTAASIDDMHFTLSCDDFRLPGQPADGIITQMHRRTLTECLQACASFVPGQAEKRCIAVNFDERLDYGWDNCYLKNEIGSGVSESGYTLAYMSSLSEQYAPPVGRQKKQLGGGGIAGIVVSIVVVIGLLMYAIRYRRRFKKVRKDRHTTEETELSSAGSGVPSPTPMASGTSLDIPETQPRRTFVRQVSSSSPVTGDASSD